MTAFLFFIRGRDVFRNTICKDETVKELKLQELLEPHREVSIPHGSYVSTIIFS
jgi:hypothetical protein